MATGQPMPPLPLQKPPGYRDPSIPTHRPPPRKPVNLPLSFRPKKRRSNCCRTFCCCFCISLAVLILIVAFAGGFFYLWFQPRLPEIHLKSVDFRKFRVSTSPDGPVLDAESSVGVEIKNPNQNLEVVYGKTKVRFSADNGDVSLGELTVRGFTQDKNNVTNLKLAMKAKKEIVDGDSAEKLVVGFRNKNLLVKAELKSGIGIKVKGWATGTAPVNLLCQGMRLSHAEEEMPECRIKILNWIYIT